MISENMRTPKQLAGEFGFTRPALIHAVRRGDITAPMKVGVRVFYDHASVSEAVRLGKLKGHKHKRASSKRAITAKVRATGIVRPSRAIPAHFRADYPAIVESIGRELNREKSAAMLASEHAITHGEVYRIANKLRKLGVAIPSREADSTSVLERVAAKLKAFAYRIS